MCRRCGASAAHLLKQALGAEEDRHAQEGVLVQAACAGAVPACRAVFLHVAAYNAPACAFYRRRGFQEVAWLPAFYHISCAPYCA